MELNKLWKKYKVEIQESEIIKRLKDCDSMLDNDEEPNDGSDVDPKGIDLGKASEYGQGSLTIDAYLTTDLLKMAREDDEKTKEQIKQMVSILGVTEEQAELLLIQTKGASNIRKRPDIAYATKKKSIDARIREEIVPRLICEYNIKEDGDDLKKCTLFQGEYWYVPSRVAKTSKVVKNNAMLAMYFNCYLRNKIGKPRKEWSDDDINQATMTLDKLEKYVDKNIKEFYNLTYQK